MPDGRHRIGFETSHEGTQEFHATNPVTGESLPTTFVDAMPGEIDRALQLADGAHVALRDVSRADRAAFLECIAGEIENLGDELLERAEAETGLPNARLTMERGRTVGQLRLFANVVRDGTFVDARIDHADPNRTPIPKPDVRSMKRSIGPVVVFGASNFPLAFSVAGGDTASALAAGCPVVVKAHPHHPGTSELTADAIVRAVRTCGLPEGTFSLVQGLGPDVGAVLVRHEKTAAVGFTGSLRGGRALFDIATSRPHPIPVFAEMGSVNPMFLLPEALAANVDAVAAGIYQSVTLGVGQFCTNPGLVVAMEGEATDALIAALTTKITGDSGGTMLHAGIRDGYAAGVARLSGTDDVECIARGAANDRDDTCHAVPAIFVTDAATVLDNPSVTDEVFGPSTLIVRCPCDSSLMEVARSLEGQLTATIHATDADHAAFPDLAATLECIAGRLLFGGFPTGVEVAHAMVHGGPYPATTAVGTTSVGTAAIDRFLRPVCWQNAPESVLPEELSNANPTGVARRIDGHLTK